MAMQDTHDPGAAAVPEEPVIDLKGVSFAYDGPPVLEDVTFQVRARDFLSIVGPNAGGKTTLIKLILGLLQPTRGSIRLFGEPPAKGRRRVGYMPQQAALSIHFPVTVIEVVLMGRLTAGRNPVFYRRADRAAGAEALARMGLADLKDRPFSALSGGQRQRTLIARALVSAPDLLLLDEPTANVDAARETEFYELLERLSADITIVLVTHDLGFVSRYVRSVACVNRRVLVHPTSDITGEMINQLYGSDVRMIRHDHRCAPEGHAWSNS